MPPANPLQTFPDLSPLVKKLVKKLNDTTCQFSTFPVLPHLLHVKEHTLQEQEKGGRIDTSNICEQFTATIYSAFHVKSNQKKLKFIVPDSSAQWWENLRRDNYSKEIWRGGWKFDCDCAESSDDALLTGYGQATRKDMV
ncbi:hypothetical protein GQR58_016652 [Nymphon striatum]|nr:hypothetical protein GQR58_016652 [Nymphon striatum]